MKLWLLRHARVELAAGTCYGMSDVPADAAHTLESARTAAAQLSPGLPVAVSALGRARQLADALHQLRPDLEPPRTDPRLNEMDFGQWELQLWDAIPRAAFDAWMADFAGHPFGGRESTQQVIDRVAQAIDELRPACMKEALWITHAGVIRAVQYVLSHGPGRICHVREWPSYAPPPGGLIYLEF
jgi:alpha-ribazole phosphatase